MPSRRPSPSPVETLLLAAAVVCLVLAVASLSAAPAASPVPPAPAPGPGVPAAAIDKAPNPHWKTDACATCHTMDGKAAKPIAPDQVDGLCVSCHDDRRAKADPHPIGVAPANEKSTPPKDWPTLDGKLGCLTCHTARKACDTAGVRPLTNPQFLRGPESRNMTKDFCVHCHEAAPYRKLNPHIVLDDKGEVITAKCLVCHEQVLDRKATARTGNARLNAAGATELCKSCHPMHAEFFNPGHLGAKITPAVQAYMVARETTGLLSRPGRELLDQIQKAGTKPTKLVPDADRKMTCATCHNPHQVGLFPAGSVLAYRAMRILDQGKLFSPVRGQTWCQHCHDL